MLSSHFVNYHSQKIHLFISRCNSLDALGIKKNHITTKHFQISCWYLLVLFGGTLPFV